MAGGNFITYVSVRTDLSLKVYLRSRKGHPGAVLVVGHLRKYLDLKYRLTEEVLQRTPLNSSTNGWLFGTWVG